MPQYRSAAACLLKAIFVLAFASVHPTAVAQNASWPAPADNPPQTEMHARYVDACNTCPVGARSCLGSSLWKLPGFAGQPTRSLDKRTQLIESNQRPGLMRFSPNWPAPFGSLHDHGWHGCGSSHRASTTQPRPRDALDRLAYFQLLPNVRCDNGHQGPGCDPYGYLGHSKTARPKY